MIRNEARSATARSEGATVWSTPPASIATAEPSTAQSAPSARSSRPMPSMSTISGTLLSTTGSGVSSPAAMA